MTRTQQFINGRAGGGISPCIPACYYKKDTYNFLSAPQNSGHRQPAVRIEYEPTHPLTATPH